MSLTGSTTSTWTFSPNPGAELGSERWQAARLGAHWASQLVAAPGASWATPEADHAHLSLSWRPRERVFAGPLVGPDHARRAALRIASMELEVLDGDGQPLATLALEGKTLAEAKAWLEQAFALDGLALPEQTPPAHPVAQGAAFAAPDEEALRQLEDGYSNAFLALERLSASLEGANPMRMWPHHFDIAVLQPLDPGNASEDAPSLGFGWSPGDGSYADGYWYVLPWPARPDEARVPLAGGGHWHDQGWFGAVLDAAGAARLGSAEQQRDGVHSFLDSARAVAR